MRRWALAWAVKLAIPAGLKVSRRAASWALFALGTAMWISRYWLMIPVLAIADSLAAKRNVAVTPGTLPTHTPLFVGLLAGFTGELFGGFFALGLGGLCGFVRLFFRNLFLVQSRCGLFGKIRRGQVNIRIDQRFALTDVRKAHESLEARATTGCTVLLP